MIRIGPAWSYSGPVHRVRPDRLEEFLTIFAGNGPTQGQRAGSQANGLASGSAKETGSLGKGPNLVPRFKNEVLAICGPFNATVVRRIVPARKHGVPPSKRVQLLSDCRIKVLASRGWASICSRLQKKTRCEQICSNSEQTQSDAQPNLDELSDTEVDSLYHRTLKKIAVDSRRPNQ